MATRIKKGPSAAQYEQLELYLEAGWSVFELRHNERLKAGVTLHGFENVSIVVQDTKKATSSLYRSVKYADGYANFVPDGYGIRTAFVVDTNRNLKLITGFYFRGIFTIINYHTPSGDWGGPKINKFIKNAAEAKGHGPQEKQVKSVPVYGVKKVQKMIAGLDTAQKQELTQSLNNEPLKVGDQLGDGHRVTPAMDALAQKADANEPKPVVYPEQPSKLDKVIDNLKTASPEEVLKAIKSEVKDSVFAENSGFIEQLKKKHGKTWQLSSPYKDFLKPQIDELFDKRKEEVSVS